MKTIRERDFNKINALLDRIPVLEIALGVAYDALQSCVPILKQRSFVPRGGSSALVVGPKVLSALEVLDNATKRKLREKGDEK